MANTITGVVTSITPVQTFTNKSGDKSYQKRSILLDCTGYDPRTGQRNPFDTFIPLDFFGEKMNEVNEVSAGDVLEVRFAISSRSYERKDGQTDYSLSLRPLSLTKLQAATASPAAQPAPSAVQPQPAAQSPANPFPPSQSEEEKGDGLPF